MNEAVRTLNEVVGPMAELLGERALDSLSSEAVLQFTVLAEAAGRCADALRVQAAAEVAERSRPGLGADSLAAQKKCANGTELLANLTRAPRSELARRVRLGSLTRSRPTLTGEILPSRFPAVAAALATGSLGCAAAQLIVNSVDGVSCADPEMLEHAEGIMVAHAIGAAYRREPAGVPCTFADTEAEAASWRTILDPDGVLPSEEEAMKGRCVSTGRSRRGLIHYRLQLMPELAGAFDALLDAYISPRTRVGFPSADEQATEDASDGSDGAASAAGSSDTRTAVQKRHDTLAGIISEAARTDSVPHLGGEYPTVLVTIREEDLLTGRGAGWIDGIDVPVSAKAVQQMVCTGGLQKVGLRADGKLVQLGSKQREFTAGQRRAIYARDGGCIIPGCTIPARRTEVHHVREHSKGGTTDCDNGVLLCWYHHRTIDTSGWCIQMRDGVPWVKAPPWLNGYVGPNPWRRASRPRVRLADSTDTG